MIIPAEGPDRETRPDFSEFATSISTNGVGIRIGPFNARMRVLVPELHTALYRFYAEYPRLERSCFYNFHLDLQPIRNFPTIHRRLVRLTVEGRRPHEDMPAAQALAVWEWGINLVIALRSHFFLMLHAAVLEKDGKALLLPAAPGFGKTTLCAALAYRGWRLLSDEFGLVRPHRSEFLPLPRPMALKNESIDVIRNFAPEAFIGPEIKGTRKGTVAHVKPPQGSIVQQADPAVADLIVFPRWQAHVDLELEPLSRSQAFMMLAMNAFNYELLGESGFTTVGAIISKSHCYRLQYSDLDEAVARLDDLNRAR